MSLTSSRKPNHARLFCLALFAIGLLLVSLVFRGVDQDVSLSASLDGLAAPTPCRQVVGAILQAAAKDASDAETPQFIHEKPA
jgi:hypothetical protein